MSPFARCINLAFDMYLPLCPQNLQTVSSIVILLWLDLKPCTHTAGPQLGTGLIDRSGVAEVVI